MDARSSDREPLSRYGPTPLVDREVSIFRMDLQPLVLLRSGHLDNVPSHFTRRTPAHDYLIIWVIRGRGFVETEGVREDVSGGQLLSCVKGCDHTYGAEPTNPWEIYWAHFDGQMAGSLLSRIRQFGAPVAPLPLNDRLLQRFVEMVTVHRQATPAANELAAHLFWAVLGLIQHTMHLSADGPLHEKLEVVENVQQYIDSHLEHVITVDQLARVANLSGRQLTRIMRQATGIAPMQYVIQQRLARAATLLTQTRTAIQQIGVQVGYPNEFHFSRAFTRLYGRSPSQYRRDTQNSGNEHRIRPGAANA